ncbi:TniB family NTP-binding protein [Sulfurirhabdus autotrophica]|uniref:TniB protein n=1 Tax=Sulfurirhabdus autotrophica TaxID=1706046 RepID=A0A4R3Y3J9_9PROT|nr:TniB family NTP-binding protein [Sulfurirhabdus autotrophica]TCV86316.1 TniB protein [Sulfurirhabdus autotrophica]
MTQDIENNESTLSTESRVQAIKRPFWIGYPRAQAIIQQMEDIFNHPKMHRMPNLAIIGETNNGKTMVLKTFCRRHTPTEEAYLEHPTLPILMLQAPPEPNEGRLYADILTSLFATAGARETADSKLQRIRMLLTNLETRMIILDEFQNTLAGSGTRLRRFLNGIKYLGNELSIPIIVAGTPETLNVLQSDPQIANRFEPVFLPKWELDEDYLRLLATIEPKLGLKHKSKLHDPIIAKRLHEESEGTIGELMKLLQKLAKDAILAGGETITQEMVQRGYLKTLGWNPPSLRNRYER